MGILARIIGALLSGGGMVVLLMGTATDSPLSFVWFILGLFMISIGFSLVSAGRQPREQKPPPPTVTEIRCTNPECDFKEIRDFEKGDYILKMLDITCPKCNSQMIVEGVYVVKEEDPKDKTPF